MTTRTEIVVSLDGRVVEPGARILRADDPMVARGDGVFETLLVRDGRVCLLEAHVARLARSAVTIGLLAPDPDRWRAVVATAAARWPDAGDAVLRLVFGRERGGGTVGFVIVSALPTRALAARRDGVSATTLDRGVTAGAGGVVPWSVAGAKSLSYAVHAAALREAERLGVGDAVLVSADGFVLEGSRSNVLILDERGVLVTPPTAMPILHGTTVRAVFETASAHGRRCQERPLRVVDLGSAQGVWLLSSVTLAARVHTLDGTVLAVPADQGDIATLVDEAVARPD